MLQRIKVFECLGIQVRIGHGDSCTTNDTIKLMKELATVHTEKK